MSNHARRPKQQIPMPGVKPELRSTAQKQENKPHGKRKNSGKNKAPQLDPKWRPKEDITLQNTKGQSPKKQKGLFQVLQTEAGYILVNTTDQARVTFSGQYRGHLSALTQISSMGCHHKYPTVLFMAKYLPDLQSCCEVRFHRAQVTTDEIVLPSRLAYHTAEGHNLRTGKLPGIASTATGNNGWFNMDMSKSNQALSINFASNCPQSVCQVKGVIQFLFRQATADELSMFQYKEGIDWVTYHARGLQHEYTVLSVQHIGEDELLGLAAELVRFGIQHYFVSRTILVLQLDGLDFEKLRNLVLSTTIYIPFGTRQQSFQLVIKNINISDDTLTQFVVNLSPVGSVPYIPLQIDKQQVGELVQGTDIVDAAALGKHLQQKFQAHKFEDQSVVEDDGSYKPVITFLIPATNKTFPIPEILKHLSYRMTEHLLKSRRQSVSCLVQWNFPSSVVNFTSWNFLQVYL